MLIDKSIHDLLQVSSDSLPKSVAIYHYTRAIRYLDEITLLCSKGFCREPEDLLNALLNLYVTIRWLLFFNPKQRIRDFMQNESGKASSEKWPQKDAKTMAAEIGYSQEYENFMLGIFLYPGNGKHAAISGQDHEQLRKMLRAGIELFLEIKKYIMKILEITWDQAQEMETLKCL